MQIMVLDHFMDKHAKVEDQTKVEKVEFWKAKDQIFQTYFCDNIACKTITLDTCNNIACKVTALDTYNNIVCKPHQRQLRVPRSSYINTHEKRWFFGRTWHCGPKTPNW
jgi:hypothetical protein